MITAIKLIPLSPHIITICVCVVITCNIILLTTFKYVAALLLIIVTTLFTRSTELTHLVTESFLNFPNL